MAPIGDKPPITLTPTGSRPQPPARHIAPILAPHKDEGPAVTTTIGKNPDVLAPGGAPEVREVRKIEVPTNGNLSDGEYIRSKFQQMIQESESRLNLPKQFAADVSAMIKRNGGKVDLLKLRDLFIKHTGINPDNVKEDNFLSIFSSNGQTTSFEDLKDRIEFYMPVFFARMYKLGEGLIQLLRKDEITFDGVYDGTGSEIDIVELAKKDPLSYELNLGIVKRYYYNKKDENALKDIEKENLSPGTKSLLFHLYNADFEKYCYSHHIKIEDVNFKTPGLRIKFLTGIFSDFVETGVLKLDKLDPSAWNFGRSKAEEVFYITPEIINNYPENGINTGGTVVVPEAE